MSSSEEIIYQCGDISKSLYDEIKFYNFDTGESTGVTGHFTQLISKDSKEVRFGIAFKGNQLMIVANYYPGGNLINQLHIKKKF